MAKIYKKELNNLRLDISSFLNNAEENFHVRKFANLMNTYLPEKEQLFTKDMYDEKGIKILLCTGAGNLIQGGSDIWVNNFLKEVWTKLPSKQNYWLLIDSKRPTDFTEKSLPKGLRFHFHFDDPNKTDKWLKECKEIISLHSHYHKRDHIWHYEDKFSTIFVHAYPHDMNSVLTEIKDLERDRVQYNTKVDADWYDDYIQTYDKRIWIGCNRSDVLKKFPNYTYTIPNYYKFKQNLPLSKNFENEKIGFAARAESRKCLHWLNAHKGYALTSRFDVQNLRDTTSYVLHDIKIFQWDYKIHDMFMRKDFSIFHGCYHKEPFGYSIFEAVDYGKLPIIHTDWGVGLNYKYRASTKNEFDKMVRKILGDSQEVRQQEFNKIKDWMKQYGNPKSWSNKILDVI